MKKLIIILVLAVVLFNSCKKQVGPTTDTIATMARDNLYGLMQDWYYWYKYLPANITVTDYKDPYTLLDALRYKTLDRWSFVDDYNAFVANMNGSFVGHGIRIGLDTQGKARIVTIYKNSDRKSVV